MNENKKRIVFFMLSLFISLKPVSDVIKMSIGISKTHIKVTDKLHTIVRIANG